MTDFDAHFWISVPTGSSPFLDPEVIKFIEDFQQLVLQEALQAGTDRKTKVINFQQPQDLEVSETNC